MTNDQMNENRGPLKLPPDVAPPTKEAARAVVNLRGHSTSDLWLAGGLAPELDAIRAEHLRVRGQTSDGIDALAELDARFAQEDHEHDENLRQAHRDGTPDSVTDGRTSGADRLDSYSAVQDRYWAGVIVLAEVVEKAIEWVRSHESELLSGRLPGVAALEEEERQARDAVVKARSKMWQLAQLGPYIKNLADDGPFGRQPVPLPAEPPAAFDAERARQMLERHWSERKPEEPVVAWQDQQQPPAQDDDETLVDEIEVSELVETGSEGAAA